MWEFKYVDVLNTDPAAGETALNALGADGWDFCFADPTSGGAHVRVWMKRAAEAEEEAEDQEAA